MRGPRRAARRRKSLPGRLSAMAAGLARRVAAYRRALTPLTARMAKWNVLPLAGFIVLPALVVRLRFSDVAPDATALAQTYIAGDTRSWWKAAAVVGCGIWMALQTLALVVAGWRPRDWKLSALAALAGAAVVVSALLSRHPYTAWIGYTRQYEGAFALLAYVAGLWYAAEMVDGRDKLALVRIVGAVALLNGMLGVAEGYGFNFWRTSIGSWLMGASPESVRFNFIGNGMACGTLFQPNHYGMFMAMTAVLGLGMVFREPGRFWKPFWLAVFFSNCIAIVFSRSRAGGLAGAAAILAALVYFAVKANAARAKFAGKNRGSPLRIRKKTMGALAVMAALTAGVVLYALHSGNVRAAVEETTARGFFGTERAIRTPVRAVALRDGRISIRLDEGEQAVFKDGDGGWEWEGGGSRPPQKKLPFPANDNEWNRFQLPGLAGHRFAYRRDGHASLAGPGFTLNFYSLGKEVFAVDYDGRFLDRMEPAPAIGFAGREYVFSDRGYIWSRALPLALNHPLFGSGPGTIALEFPNSDLFASQVFYQNDDTDKAHSMPLSLLVHLGMFGAALYAAVFIFALHRAVAGGDPLAMPLFFAAGAFLLGSLTNDSTVGTTPVFCAVLGLASSSFFRDSRESSDAENPCPAAKNLITSEKS